MIYQNKLKKRVLIHLLECNIFRILNPGENININEKFDVYEEVEKSNLQTLTKNKKVRI